MRSFRAVLIGTACVFSSAGTAWAQETLTVSGTAAPAPTDVAGADGDIVVTAQRRNERLQDVPVSITALSGDQLADKRIASPTDLVSSVPNLQAASTVGEGIPVFSLRGISMSDYSINQQGPVATYIDDVYKGTFPLLPVALYDLERVEVLRGPQGTLYGKNTTGGAINIISRRPGFSTEGYLAVGIGNYQRYEANGALQAALSDKVAARVAFTFARADGWFKNRLPGQADANATRQYAVRVSLLAQPTDRLQFLLRLSTSLQNPTNYGIFARPAADGIGANAGAVLALPAEALVLQGTAFRLGHGTHRQTEVVDGQTVVVTHVVVLHPTDPQGRTVTPVARGDGAADIGDPAGAVAIDRRGGRADAREVFTARERPRAELERRHRPGELLQHGDGNPGDRRHRLDGHQADAGGIERVDPVAEHAIADEGAADRLAGRHGNELVALAPRQFEPHRVGREARDVGK